VLVVALAAALSVAGRFLSLVLLPTHCFHVVSEQVGSHLSVDSVQLLTTHWTLTGTLPSSGTSRRGRLMVMS
jgi:hypothetical protein